MTFPNRDGLHPDAFAARVDKGHGCWHCPVRCKAVLKSGEGEYKYAAGSSAGIRDGGILRGTVPNNNTESIIMANDICNRAGLDTISAGTVIAFAIELYENGILTQKDTDGIDLKWGNHRAMVAMTRETGEQGRSWVTFWPMA